MFEKIKVNLARRGFAKSDAKRDSGLKIPDEVTLHEGIVYDSSHKLTLDINLPKAVENPPLIVNVHGGGYFYGSTLPYRYYCADLARRGFAVVNFNYRLAPDFKFPTPLYDLNAVMGWCLDNAAKYGYDTNNIFMVGDSAGAQLASQYAAIVSNPEYAALMEIEPPKGLELRAIGLNCGMYDLAEVVGEIGKPGDLMECYFTKNYARFGKKLDVLGHIDSRYPPAYLISSPGDFLLPCCEPMYKHLREKGVDAKFKIYGDEKTGHVFHVNVRHRAGQQANDEELAFFKEHIK